MTKPQVLKIVISIGEQELVLSPAEVKDLKRALEGIYPMPEPYPWQTVYRKPWDKLLEGGPKPLPEHPPLTWAVGNVHLRLDGTSGVS